MQPLPRATEDTSVAPKFLNLAEPSLGGEKYLEFFRLYTIPKFSSYYDSTIWQIILAQTCISNSALECAAAALGVAHHEHENSRYREGYFFTNTEKVDDIYLQALSGSRQILESLPLDFAIRIGFILAFLLAGVESLKGVYSNAIMHLANGLKIAFSRDCIMIYQRSSLSFDFDLAVEVPVLLSRLKTALLNTSDINYEQNCRSSNRVAFHILREAYLGISKEVQSLTENIDTEKLGIFATRLEAWDIQLAELSVELSNTDLYRVRLMKLYREAAYLLLLVKANDTLPKAFHLSTGNNAQRVLGLKVHFSKLVMLADQLAHDKTSVIHLCHAQLKSFAIKNCVFSKKSLKQHAPITNIRLVPRNAAEQLVMLEEDAIRESGLVPSNGMCMDVTSALDRGTVSIRFCVVDASGMFLWVEKRAQIWRPVVFQNERMT